MKKLIIEPTGWPCFLSDYENGFFVHGNRLGFKNALGAFWADGKSVFPEVCSNASVHTLQSSPSNNLDANATGGTHMNSLTIQPVTTKWID